MGGGGPAPVRGTPARASALAPEADRLYRLGRYYWQLRTLEGMTRSIGYFRAVVAAAPDDVLGFAGLADAYAELAEYRCDGGPPCARETALAARYAAAALTRDPNAAAALTSQARIIDLADGDPDRADAWYRRAIAADPRYAIAHEWRGLELLSRGRLTAARAELTHAAQLEPVATVIYAGLARAAFYQRDYRVALAYAREAIALNPRRVESLVVIGLASEELGRASAARTAFRRLAAVDADVPDERALEAALSVRAGRRTPGLRALDAIVRSHPRGDYALLDAALGYVAAGRPATALRLLPRVRFGYGLSRTWLALDPRLDPVRRDRRFASWTRAD